MDMKTCPWSNWFILAFLMTYFILESVLPVDAAKLTIPNSTGTVLIEAYNLDGNLVTLADFINSTYYKADSSNRWSISENYGVFPVGTPPAIPQIGSDPFLSNIAGQDHIGFAVPSNQRLYFTCLWKASKIGSVFMRADNGGSGFQVQENQSIVLQLPYEFALSEFINRLIIVWTLRGIFCGFRMIVGPNALGRFLNKSQMTDHSTVKLLRVC